ncbi:ribosomal RNA small subunit methyltransferase B [bacterium BMS3Bbin14]|nr:ribosomal RNA small subunit methyltransferase B [bacterium BMS3Abin13]GBE53376.1 ribosomal RNA small subunit methyltransferase B [bacterium BMS3Bbin14]
MRVRPAGTGRRQQQPTSRRLAVLCLCRRDRDGSVVQVHIDRLIHGSSLAGPDRQLAVMLVRGVLRQQQFLDAVIARFSSVPPGKMKPLTLMALRVGVYQLFFLDRIPASAAVNETVKVLRAEKQPRWLINFVNGVLRTVARQRASLPGPDVAGKNGTPILNHPDWLLRRWRARYGPERAEEICRQNNLEPPLTLRVNTRLISREALADRCRSAGHEVRNGSYAPDALILESGAGAIANLPGFAEGFFQVQGEAAQLATLLLAPFAAGRSYLDACAGLGGKTGHLAQLLPAGAELTAVEPDPRRFALLGENLRRLGADGNITLFNGGLDEFAQSGGKRFDAILVDAPCSGTGVIRRHPDIRWNRQEDDLRSYQRQQGLLLHAAASLLAPGGILVYATCSLEPEENQQVIAAFRKTHSGFTPADCRDFLPPAAGRLIAANGCFYPTPADGLDGFFAARLEYISS